MCSNQAFSFNVESAPLFQDEITFNTGCLTILRQDRTNPNYSPDFGYFRQVRWVGRIDGGVLI